MPYRWTSSPDTKTSRAELHLWPYRSLPRTGFVWVIAITAGLLSLPLLSILGSGVLWGVLPFAALVVWGLWYAIQTTYRSGAIHETLVLTPDALTVTRRDPGKTDRVWSTNPYWVRSMLRRDGPVEEYLTLTDGQREIELGEFLTPEERVALHGELGKALARMR